VPSAAFALPDRALVLDRYRPLRPLGRGGSGSVWLARDEQTGLDVALKIVPREGKRAARAAREMEAASRLRHERCVRAYDFGADEGHVYIAYEYVRGRTLREVIRSGELDDAASVELAAQILEGLAHAHRHGIVHRDVKPSNVLVEDGDGLSARVLDFGLAQFDEADTLTAVGDVPGTLAYISPERLGGSEASERSDVWAVGVILWEALAGSHPFWGVPLPEVASTIASGAPPLSARRGDLSRRLLTAVDAALSVDPAKRPPAARLATELRDAGSACRLALGA
jgi:serine/threonine-protein kinase